MPDDKDAEDLGPTFEQDVEALSMHLLQVAIDRAQLGSATALAALAMAAGRAFGMTGVRVGQGLNVMATQYELMRDLMTKRDAPPAELPPEFKKWLS